jgi:hypothetical protein
MRKDQGTGGMTQAVKCLLSKCESLSSNSDIAKKKKKGPGNWVFKLKTYPKSFFGHRALWALGQVVKHLSYR